MRLGKRERKALRVAVQEIDRKRQARIDAVGQPVGKYRSVWGNPNPRGMMKQPWGNPDGRKNSFGVIYS